MLRSSAYDDDSYNEGFSFQRNIDMKYLRSIQSRLAKRRALQKANRHSRRRSTLGVESLEDRVVLTCDLACAEPDTFAVQQNSDWITLDVIANDEFSNDYAGDRLITAASNGSLGGQVEILNNGQSLRYKPAVETFGTETFGYIVDGELFANVEVDIPAPVSDCLLYTSPSPRDATLSRMPSSA